MKLPVYQLGRVSWQHSQLYYHALARLGREGLILCRPAAPYICLGYHQDAAQELDLAWLKESRVPYFRREAGGGAVYLDEDQVFWQLVLRRDNPLVTLNRAAFFRRFLQPVIRTCRSLGVNAELLAPNDVAVAGRRICGTGAGEIGDCVVFVGNILRGFDSGLMARASAAPDEFFRRCFQRAMDQWITSLRREMGPEAEAAVTGQKLYTLLAQGFAAQVGAVEQARVDEALFLEMRKQARRMLAPHWLGYRRKPRPSRRVKVRAGLFLCHASIDAAFGALKCACTVNQGKVEKAAVYGDGSLRPAGLADALASRLIGRSQAELLPSLRSLALELSAEQICAKRQGAQAWK